MTTATVANQYVKERNENNVCFDSHSGKHAIDVTQPTMPGISTLKRKARELDGVLLETSFYICCCPFQVGLKSNCQ